MADMDAPKLEPEDDDFPEDANCTNCTENEPILSQLVYKDTEARLRRFLDAYGQTLCVSTSCQIAGISRRLIYYKLETDEVFRRAFEKKQTAAGDLLEGAVFERALHGVKKQLFYQGEPVILNGEYVYVTEFDTHREHILLKRLKREAYTERVEQQITGELSIIERLEAGRRRLIEMKHNDGTGS